MKHINTQGIVLRRTDFGEADRIITFLTPDQGKVGGLARGVRKQKSKLAGGIELFSVSDISYIVGRGEVSTLTSTRLLKHYGNIVKNLDRTNAGYQIIKTLNKVTEENPEPAYFELLKNSFAALDDASIDLDLVQAWFVAQILKLAGHTPNLKTDIEGYALQQGKQYDFNFDTMSFQASQAKTGAFGSDHIKFMRLIFSDNKPAALQKVQGCEKLATAVLPLLQSCLQVRAS